TPQTGLVVGGSLRVETVEEPGAELRARQRNRRIARAARYRRCSCGRYQACAPGFDARGHRRERSRIVEQRIDGDRDAEHGLDLREEQGTAQRVASQHEEIDVAR